MKRLVLFVVLASVVLGPFLPGTAPVMGQETIAITNTSVVDVETGAIEDDRTVVVTDGMIAAITDEPPPGVIVIDGTGKYVMPGIWDMHVHIRNQAAPTILFPQFVLNGVLGVRGMGSDCGGVGPACLPELKEWQSQIDAGELFGPRLIELSSFPMNPPFDRQPTEEQARTLVRRAAERGADLIKVYYRLSPETLDWVIDEARAHGMYAGGHIPIRMTAAEVSDAGMRTLEHARDFLFDCFPGSADFRSTTTSQNPPMDVMRSMVDDHDPAICQLTFDRFIANDTWYVPTHVTRRMDAYANDPDFRNDERRRFIPDFAWTAWQEDADGMVALDPSPEGRRTVRSFYETGLAITGRAHDAGVNIVLGTDAGDTYVFPGSGAHDELGELVKAGLTPAEALRTATIEAARFAGLEELHGTVEAGKRADLLLLDGNPLDDISNTRRIVAVIFNGDVLDRAELDALEDEVVERVAAFGEGR